MDIPEKIYLVSDKNEAFVFTQKRSDNLGIEYTRTDAFVEKMQLFLIDNLKEIPIGGGKIKIKAECSLEEFISNLENYMKGE